MAHKVYCSSATYYQVIALVIEEICLGSEGCMRWREEHYLWFSVPGNFCLTSNIWTAMNPAKTLQKLCQLKEAGQNVGRLPRQVYLCKQSCGDSLQQKCP